MSPVGLQHKARSRTVCEAAEKQSLNECKVDWAHCGCPKEEEMTAYLGIDVAKATLDVALWVEGKALQHGQFSNDTKGFKQLARWLSKHAKQDVHACLEATGRYSDEVAAFLVEAGCAVSVVNPARIKGLC
jgi:hypothetical protein